MVFPTQALGSPTVPALCPQRGETALHMAARAGQVEVVRCLLRNGALVDARARVGAGAPRPSRAWSLPLGAGARVPELRMAWTARSGPALQAAGDAPQFRKH